MVMTLCAESCAGAYATVSLPCGPSTNRYPNPAIFTQRELASFGIESRIIVSICGAGRPPAYVTDFAGRSTRNLYIGQLALGPHRSVVSGIAAIAVTGGSRLLDAQGSLGWMAWYAWKSVRSRAKRYARVV